MAKNPIFIAPRGPQGPEGPRGPAGPKGPPGPPGQGSGEGVPAGGTAGQVLAKVDAVDYNTEWVDNSGGGGGGGLASVSDDPAPQLGGDLDVNGNALNNSGPGRIVVNDDAEVNGLLLVQSTAPSVQMYDTNAGVDEKRALFYKEANQFIMRTLTDAGGALSTFLRWLQGTLTLRLGESASKIELSAPTDVTDTMLIKGSSPALKMEETDQSQDNRFEIQTNDKLVNLLGRNSSNTITANFGTFNLENGNVAFTQANRVFVPEPLAPASAATKAYVDSVGGGSGGGDGVGNWFGDSPPADTTAYPLWSDTSTGRQFFWEGSFWVEIAGTPPDFTPSAYDLSQFGGFVAPSQGGFGFSIDGQDGDPEGALELLGGARAAHRHKIDWKIVDTSTYTIIPDDDGMTILFNIPSNGTCDVTLQNQANQGNWQAGMNIGLLAYSSGAVTISPEASVNVDGVTATPFTLVQHGMASLSRMPANDFWNFSGQKGP